VAGLVGRPVFWVVAVLLLGGWPLVSGLLRRPPPPPPVLGTLPGFELVGSGGERVDRSALAQRVWVIGFADTSCVSCAERLGTALERLQYRSRNVGTAVGLLTVAVGSGLAVVDIAQEALRHHANPRQWRSASGPDAPMLMSALAAMVPERSAMLKTGGALVLVDGEGRIRGVDSVDTQVSMDRLVSDMTVLLNSR
jgi:hypothetical protein